MASFRHLFSSDGTSTASAYSHHSQHLSKLVLYLESPEWITRTDEYLEQESIMFDPSVPDCDLYKQIHENYKILVDKMLTEFRVVTKTTPEQLQESILDAKKQGQTNKIVKELIEPLLLYDDFERFKEIMINQNIQLQTQAMELIQKKTGSFPFTATSPGEPANRDNRTDDALMDLVLKRSKEEYDELQRRLQEEEAAIEKALRESEQLAQLLANQTRVSVHDLRELVQQMEALTTVAEEEDEHAEAATRVMPSVPTVTITSALSGENADDFVSVKQFISPEELKRRQEYLRAQRDKLLSKKEALRATEAASTAAQESKTHVVKPDESRKILAKKLQTQIGTHGSLP